MKKRFSASIFLIVVGIVSGAYAADAQTGERISNRSQGTITQPTAALVVTEQRATPMRYYGGPKSPMWHAQVEN